MMKHTEIQMENRENFPLYRTVTVNEVTYFLNHQIAKGHFSTLYEARDSWGNPLAVKIFHSRTDSVIFDNETQQFRRFASPQVVHMYEAFSYEGEHYILMERFGVALSRVKTPDRDTRAKIFIESARHMLQALHRIHLAGYLHGDINPQNVLIEIKNNQLLGVKLCDFGLCRKYGTEDNRLARFASWILPPECFSETPETLRGAIDVYHAALVLYSIVSDEKLEYTESEILGNKPQRDVLNSNIPSVRGLAPALEMDPANRISAIELWKNILRFIG
jgi:serine/threonine protein kinase